uniref:Defensin n=1 Tax=Ruditapes philippinarum TaxID=129788 RepID=J7FS28_RUDPH|nr:defensin [Ruditapes philippinarum]AFP50031.1 defensin [Ruditapes philippinarum]AFP50052.1 defensin [Ruditapes philippinarum]
MRMMIVFTVIFLAAMFLQDVEAGFGCPDKQYECHNHCKYSVGCRGGYCDVLTLRYRCTCYGCKKRRSIQE